LNLMSMDVDTIGVDKIYLTADEILRGFEDISIFLVIAIAM
jgi:hypothetical protein